MPTLVKKITREKIVSIVRPVYKETWIISVFMLLHLVIGPNRIYLLALALLIIFLYKISGNFLNTLWLAFLATLPFGRGRFFEHIVISKANWAGDYDLSFNIAILFSDVLLAVIVYVLLSRFKTSKRKYKVSKHSPLLFLSLLFFLVSAATSAYFARFPWTSTYFYLQLAKFIILFFVSIAVFKSEIIFRKTLQILGLFIFLNALLVVGQYFNRGPIGLNIEGAGPTYGFFAVENPELYRPGGFAADPNIAASFFTAFFPLILINTIISNKQWTRITWVTIGIFLAAFIFTASRVAWTITAASSLFGIWYVKKFYKTYIPRFLSKYWLVLLAISIIVFAPLIADRLATISDIFNKEGGGTFRVGHLKVGWHYISSRPQGVGIGLFPFAMAQDFPIYVSGLRPTLAHNIFAQIGAELGFIGLTSFIAFLWLLVRKFLNSLVIRKLHLSPFAFSIFLAFTSFVALSSVFPWFLHPSIGWLFWILGAYVYSQAV